MNEPVLPRIGRMLMQESVGFDWHHYLAHLEVSWYYVVVTITETSKPDVFVANVMWWEETNGYSARCQREFMHHGRGLDSLFRRLYVFLTRSGILNPPELEELHLFAMKYRMGFVHV